MVIDMNNIEIIDYAIKATMDKGGSFSSENYISSALKQYAKLNYSKGFTSNKSARKYIETLSKDDIDRELLKNIIKKRAYAETNGYNVLLNTNKTINDELTISELELILIKNMDEAPLDVAKYLLDKLPKVRSLLINSFVDQDILIEAMVYMN